MRRFMGRSRRHRGSSSSGGAAAPLAGDFFEAAAAMISRPGERRNRILAAMRARAATPGGRHPEYSFKSCWRFTVATTLAFLGPAPLRVRGARRKRSRTVASLAPGGAVSAARPGCAPQRPAAPGTRRRGPPKFLRKGARKVFSIYCIAVPTLEEHSGSSEGQPRDFPWPQQPTSKPPIGQSTAPT